MSSGCIALLLYIFGAGNVYELIALLPAGTYLVIFLLCCASVATLAGRFQFVLGSIQVKESWPVCFSLQLMGLAVNQFMPGIYGGDLLRVAYFMPDHAGRRVSLAAAVIFERICGLLAMMAIGVYASLHTWLQSENPLWLFYFLGIIALATTSYWLFGYIRSVRLRVRYLQGIFKLGGETRTQLLWMLADGKLVVSTVFLSSLSQAITIFTFYYLLKIFHADVPPAGIAAVVTLGWLVTLLPLSLNGLGIREGGLVAGFIALGVAETTALSVSLIALLPTMALAAIGIIVLCTRYARFANLKQMCNR